MKNREVTKLENDREELHTALDKTKAIVFESKMTLPAVMRKAAIVLKDVAR